MTPFWSPWSPLQGDTTKWGEAILITLVTFARQHTWMGQPNFYRLDCLHKPTPRWGDPISVALNFHSGNIKTQNPSMDRATKFYNQFQSFFNIKLYDIRHLTFTH
jgi:hypothetical protein